MRSGTDAVDDIVARCIAAAWRDRPMPAITRTTRFDELGVDSVELIEIVFGVEQVVAREFTEAELLAIETVGDLCRLAGEAE